MMTFRLSRPRPEDPEQKMRVVCLKSSRMKHRLLSSILMASLMTAADAKPFTCPRVGGDLVYGQEANIDTLDEMTTPTISTRNIGLNIHESLMTRDESGNPILELASAMTEAADQLTYTFRLRGGIVFHNG